MNDLKGKFDDNQAWLVNLPGAPQIGKWYRLEITAAGNEISFYIDGEIKHKAEDDLHPSGGVILYAYNAIVEFDNVIITGDDIPGYAVEPGAKSTATWGWLKR